MNEEIKIKIFVITKFEIKFKQKICFLIIINIKLDENSQNIDFINYKLRIDQKILNYFFSKKIV